MFPLMNLVLNSLYICVYLNIYLSTSKKSQSKDTPNSHIRVGKERTIDALILDMIILAKLSPIETKIHH